MNHFEKNHNIGTEQRIVPSDEYQITVNKSGQRVYTKK